MPDVFDLHSTEVGTSYTGMMTDRITRPCSSCGGKRTCRWADEAWVCFRCGDEWYPDHGDEYAPPYSASAVSSKPTSASNVPIGPPAGGAS